MNLSGEDIKEIVEKSRSALKRNGVNSGEGFFTIKQRVYNVSLNETDKQLTLRITEMLNFSEAGGGKV
jgi:hypothetical protein